MVKTRSRKVRKSFRHSKKRGAGYSVGPEYVSAGNLVNNRYPGPNDCAGVPTRFGLANVTPRGLPGLSGGKRRGRKAIRGGRYASTFQELSPNGVGMSSYTTVGSIPCERGTTNSLNPNPNGIQSMTTLPKMSGGANIAPASVSVGDFDSMRYYTPNAGYTNNPVVLPPGGASPGFMAQIGYPAGQFNRACLTTGGGLSVANSVGAFTKVTTAEIGNRSDFDGTIGGLPVKFGGKRSKRRKTSKKSRKVRKSKKHSRKH